MCRGLRDADDALGVLRGREKRGEGVCGLLHFFWRGEPLAQDALLDAVIHGGIDARGLVGVGLRGRAVPFREVGERLVELRFRRAEVRADGVDARADVVHFGDDFLHLLDARRELCGIELGELLQLRLELLELLFVRLDELQFRCEVFRMVRWIVDGHRLRRWRQGDAGGRGDGEGAGRCAGAFLDEVFHEVASFPCLRFWMTSQTSGIPL